MPKDKPMTAIDATVSRIDKRLDSAEAITELADKILDKQLTSHAESILRSGLPVLRCENSNCDLTLLISDRLYKKLQQIQMKG